MQGTAGYYKVCRDSPLGFRLAAERRLLRNEKWVTTLRAAGDFFASVLMAKAIFLIFGVKRVLHRPCIQLQPFLCRKAQAAPPMCSMLLLLVSDVGSAPEGAGHVSH